MRVESAPYGAGYNACRARPMTAYWSAVLHDPRRRTWLLWGVALGAAWAVWT